MLSGVFADIRDKLFTALVAISNAAYDVADIALIGGIIVKPIWALYDVVNDLWWAFSKAAIKAETLEENIDDIWDHVDEILSYTAEHYLSIVVVPGETLWHSISRHVVEFLGIETKWNSDLWGLLWDKIKTAVHEEILPALPSADSILYLLYQWWELTFLEGDTWWSPVWRKITSLMGIVQEVGESWFEALTRVVNASILPALVDLIPSWDAIQSKLLEWFEIGIEVGESLHDALLRMISEGLPSPEEIWNTIIETLPEISGLVTWWHEFTEPVQAFFSDPWEWLTSKFTDWFLGSEV